MPAWRLGLIVTLLLAPEPAQSADIQPALSDYAITSWADRDGVPIGTVYAIGQTRDGYLWLGTDAGLIRFDGFRFRTADEVLGTGLPRARALALSVGRDGDLLVGFTNGEVRRIGGNRIQDLGRVGNGRIDAVADDTLGKLGGFSGQAAPPRGIPLVTD